MEMDEQSVNQNKDIEMHQIDTTADVHMQDMTNVDGFVNPESPRAQQQLSPEDIKVNQWKKTLHQGGCMEQILRELRNERPFLSLSQLRVVFTLLLDRMYNLKDAPIQEQVSTFFADELCQTLAKEELTSEDIDLVCFIFTENHSIFNYRVSANSPQIMQRLAKTRYPDSDELVQRDLAFVQSLCEKNNSALFSHYYAHFALNLQKGHESFVRLVKAAGFLGVPKIIQVTALLNRLKKYIRNDTWESLGAVISDTCLLICSQDSSEVKKVTKKEILDFTDNLEHILLHAYKQSTQQTGEFEQIDQELTEKQKSEKAEFKILQEERRREFVYRTPELIYLEYALTCLKMPVLEKKLSGATMLVMKVVSVGKPGVRKTATNSLKKEASSVLKWMTEDILIDWLRQKKIFSVFFGTSLHPEVIKKSFFLLDFLYRHGELTEKELSKMWHIATKKHEAFKVSIIRSLIFMASRMAPKELHFLFTKLQGMQLREHDKFSLLLLKSIAKALAPTQKETQKKADAAGATSKLTSGILDEFDKRQKPRGRAGSFDGQKSGSQFEVGQESRKRKGLHPQFLMDDLDLMGGAKKRRDSKDSMKNQPGDENLLHPTKRRQRSFSPGAREKSKLKSGGLNFNFKVPDINDEEDADLQAAIAMSMAAEAAAQEETNDNFEINPLETAGQSPAQTKTRGGSTGYEPRAEDLFEVPADKQSKKTADGEMSPEITEEEYGFKADFSAAKALDLPISTSHSPQTAEKIPGTQVSCKPTNFGDEQKNNQQADGEEQDIKVAIADCFFNDTTLGLVNSVEEVARHELASQVLTFMWQLCLDDSVFGFANSNLTFENQNLRGQHSLTMNRLEASQRPKKGLSVQNHQLCIDQFTEVINFNYPVAWFYYIHESTRRLKANMQSMTMQLIIRKLLLGTQFPMIEKPAKHEALVHLDGDLDDEAYVLGLSPDQQQLVVSYREQVKNVRALPRSRIDLLKALEEGISLTGACLSSYICFKSEALQLIYAYNFGNVHEEEYLETQSSLDGDDDKLMQNTSVTSGDHLVGQQISAASLSEHRNVAQLQNQMDVDITSEDQGTNMFASSIDPSRINDRLTRVMQVASRMHSRSDVFSLEEGKEEFKHPQSARLPNHTNSHNLAHNGGGQRDSRNFLDTMVTNRVYNYTFAKEMTERLDFLRFLVALSPETMLKPEQIQIMWECLVSNAYYEKERDMFFFWCTEILTAARKKQSARQSNGVFDENKDFFSDDCLELLFFDTLLKLDFRFFTDSIYNCFESFFIHVNEQYGQIVTTFQTQLEIFDFKLIGIEALIEIVLQVRDTKVQEKASAFLMKIYKSLNKQLMDEKIAEIKMDLLSVCISNIRKGQQELNESGLLRSEADLSIQALTASDHQNRVARSIQILSKFIEQFEGCKDQSKKGKTLKDLSDPQVKVTIQNQVLKTQGPIRFDMTLSANSSTVQSIMNKCAETIYPKRDISELTLTYKGKDLKEHMLKTLKQVMGSTYGKAESVIIILSSKSSIEMDYMEQELAIFGTKTGEAQYDPVLLKEKVDELKIICTEAPDQVIELAIRKCNFNLEEAIMMVITEEGIAELQAEIVKEQEERQDSNLMVIANEQNQAQGDADEDQLFEDKLNLIVSNKAEYFDLLFELLNLGVPDITQAVWKLMMQVPINQKLFNSMRSLEKIAADRAFEADQFLVVDTKHGWQSIIDPNSPYKMLYSLQILNTLVSVNNQVLSDIEVQERFEWRQKFLELGGFTHLYMILITADINDMISVSNKQSESHDPKKLGPSQRHLKKARSKLLKTSLQPIVPAKKGNGNQIDQVRCLSLLISIVKIFLHAALLTVDYENLLSLVVQSSTSPFRNDRKKVSPPEDAAKGKHFEQLVTQGLTDKANRSYGREAGASDSGSRTGNTSGTGTPVFGSDQGGVKNSAEEKAHREPSNTSMQSINMRPKNTYTQVDDFPKLVEQIKQNGLALKLLDQVIDFQELMRKLLLIIYSAVIYQEETNAGKKPDEKPEVGNVEQNANEALSELLQHALDLMLPCIIWQPELLLKEIYDFENLEKLLIRALTQTQDENARKAVERTFRTISTYKMQVNRGSNLNAFEAIGMQDSNGGSRESAVTAMQISDELSHQKFLSPKVHILKILLKNLPGANSKLVYCEEFFNLITNIIRACADNFVLDDDDKIGPPYEINFASNQVLDISRLVVNKEEGHFSASYLLQVFVQQIKSRPITETKANSQTQPDHILQGYLQITQALLEVSPAALKTIAGSKDSHNLVKLLFQFLFELPNTSYKQPVSNLLTASFSPHQSFKNDLPKCKAKLTRKRTFNLLYTLCSGQPANYMTLLGNLFMFHKEIQEATKVANEEQIEDFLEGLVNPNSVQHSMRSDSGYVGLRNFGCTCYMNSLIQQLFMTPDFRKGILSVKLPQQIEPTETTKLVLRELQTTFANLQETVKEFYAPSGFIRSFQFHGVPVNVREQQDTHEFYNVLCDYLESSSPEVARILKSSVGGVLCNEIKSLEKEYSYVGESEELFSALSLDIKNKRRLQDALDLYVRPDILDGDNKYFCEKHQKHIDAQKRTYLKSLSDTVVINLKRFEYDFQTLQRSKINDYCEFPELIDLRPWTKQGIEEQENTGIKKRSKSKNRQTSLANYAAQRKESGVAGNSAMEEEFEESPDLQEDDEICDEEMLSDQVSQGDVAELDGKGSSLGECGRFSENDAIESSENSRPINTEEADGDFEDFIAQEEDQDKTTRAARGTNGEKTYPRTRGLPKKQIKSTKFGEESSKQNEKRLQSDENKNEFLYQLVGVLVHSGSANSGHYYSYIKERGEKGRWLEFNDRVVREFDFQNLSKECFGTPPENKQAKASGNMQFTWERHSNAYLLFYERVHPTKKVEKVTAQEIPSVRQFPEPLPLVDNSDFIMYESDSAKVEPPADHHDAPSKLVNSMSKDLYQAIQVQNQAFLQLKLFYDSEYFQFIRDFVSQFKSIYTVGNSGQQDEIKNSLYFSKSESASFTQKQLVLLTQEFRATKQGEVNHAKFITAYNKIVDEGDSKVLDIFQDPFWVENFQKDPSLSVLKFAMTISFDIALKVKDVNGFVNWIQVLEPFFARSAHSCLWFIKYMHFNKKVLNSLLLENPSYEVRESFSRLLKIALNVTVKNEEPYLLEECTYLQFTDAQKPDYTMATEAKSAAIRFCQYFCGEMLDTKVRENWRRFEEYFDILTDFTQSSFPVARFLIENQAIYRILEFVMNKQPPFSKSTFVKMGGSIGNSVQPAVRQPLDLLSYLIRCTVTSGITGQSKYAPTSVFQDEERNISIPASEIHFLLRSECLTELLNRCADAQSEDAQKALAGIVQHLSWGDRNVSQFFISQLVEYVKAKQNKMTAGAAGQNGLPNELESAFKVLRGLLTLQDEPLQKERYTFLFDLQQHYVDSKPFLTMIQQLKSRNAKFVLYALAFVAEIALSDQGGHQLVSYLYEHNQQMQQWILQFLEHHAFNSTSPLKVACGQTITNCLASWRQILQVTEPLTVERDLELDTAQIIGEAQSEHSGKDRFVQDQLMHGASPDYEMGGIASFQDPGNNDGYYFDGDLESAGNQFEINEVLAMALDEIEQPTSPRGNDDKGNISFDEMNHSFN